MRKLITTALLSAGLSLFAVLPIAAQSISVGGGVGYGSESEDLNFQVNAYYGFENLPLRIGGDVGYSEPEDNLTQIEGNVNLHLMAIDSDLLSLYGITGLNVVHLRFSFNDITESETDTGVNLGAGAEFDLGFGRAFGEAKYILGSDREEQLVLGAGIRVSISN
jgi:opacity protein-like surface antigen